MDNNQFAKLPSESSLTPLAQVMVDEVIREMDAEDMREQIASDEYFRNCRELQEHVDRAALAGDDRAKMRSEDTFRDNKPWNCEGR